MSAIGDNLVSDMIALLEQEWIPDEKKSVIKKILLAAIDNMGDYIAEMEKHK